MLGCDVHSVTQKCSFIFCGGFFSKSAQNNDNNVAKMTTHSRHSNYPVTYRKPKKRLVVSLTDLRQCCDESYGSCIQLDKPCVCDEASCSTAFEPQRISGCCSSAHAYHDCMRTAVGYLLSPLKWLPFHQKSEVSVCF